MALSTMNTYKPQAKTNIYTQQPKTTKNKPSFKNVRQDKARFFSAREASRQPAAVTKVDRALPLNKTMVCSHNSNVQQNRTVKLTLWVKPIVKDELERLAKREGLSLSAAGAAFLEKSLQQQVDLQYNALLTPIIEKAIAKNLRRMATRLSWLLVRVAFDAGQIRGIVTNILGHQPGMKQELLKTILIDSAKSAKGNITRRTPQMTELMEAIEKWLVEGEEDSGS